MERVEIGTVKDAMETFGLDAADVWAVICGAREVRGTDGSRLVLHADDRFTPDGPWRITAEVV